MPRDPAKTTKIVSTLGFRPWPVQKNCCYPSNQCVMLELPPL